MVLQAPTGKHCLTDYTVSPHYYNLEEEVDRCVAALDRYLRRGV
jgi:selenocysteine lyase/cysteine desulfurase